MNTKLTHLAHIMIGVPAFVGLTTMQAMAVDLTGTWTGTATCQRFLQGESKFQVAIKDVEFEISQLGSDLNLRLVNPLTGQPANFDGVVVDDGVNTTKAEAALLECTSGVESIGGAMIRAKVSADPTSGKGSFKGTVFAADSDPLKEVATCKLSFKRVDAADPVVPGCQ